MGDFTDYVKKAAAQGGSIPSVGVNHYAMGGIAFSYAMTAFQFMSSIANQVLAGLEQQGQFEAARKFRENPQPFMGAPHAMAVFMAASEEIQRLQTRVSRLEQVLKDVADDLAIRDSSGGDSLARSYLNDAVRTIQGALAESEKDDDATEA